MVSVLRHLTIVWALAAAACGGSRSSDAAAAERLEPRTVRLVAVTEVPMERTIVVAGDLAAEEQVVLSLKVPGRVESISVDLGSTVTGGEVIARLESKEYQLRVAQAEGALREARARLGLADGAAEDVDPVQLAVVRQTKALLDEAELTLGRVRTFVERGLAPRADLDAAEASFKVAESRHQEALEEVRGRQAVLAQRRSELEIAREQLSEAVLRAPFSGRIVARAAAPGQYVSAGTPVATLVRLHPLRLRVEVPERGAGQVRIGQPVRIAVEGEDGTYTGKIARLSPAISSDNRTLLVEAEIPNDPPQLRPGAFVRAEIVVEAARPTLVIPADAVVSFAGVDKVFVVEDGRTAERRVRLGRREGQLVELQQGLAAGDSIIAQPGAMVAGQPVQIDSR